MTVVFVLGIAKLTPHCSVARAITDDYLSTLPHLVLQRQNSAKPCAKAKRCNQHQATNVQHSPKHGVLQGIEELGTASTGFCITDKSAARTPGRTPECRQARRTQGPPGSAASRDTSYQSSVRVMGQASVQPAGSE